MWQELLAKLQQGDTKALARCISLVENEHPGYETLLKSLPASKTGIIGITGPPGAGKSTLTDALIGVFVQHQQKVAVVCVDPSSPFNLGAVLGDRIRMSDWYTNENVYIRSLATRGSMGGLHPKIIEIADLIKAAPFDYIIVETVGVGQSEVEIAGLADVTIVVVVPEAGDEVQTMKAGLMEIADIFVVNKADRPDADMFVRNLRLMLAPSFSKKQTEIPVVKTIAARKEGVKELYELIRQQLDAGQLNERTFWLLAEKAYYLIEQKRMKDVDKKKLKAAIEAACQQGNFNLYQFIAGL
ncbi:MAG: methylmalonyl Co-A mutase-associated GTPase MeaB [Chitinophagales bacterium]|nr:methylmalonyl Co-A mutase-associated GTPase MeaB [Chitinophagales bacterium]